MIGIDIDSDDKDIIDDDDNSDWSYNCTVKIKHMFIIINFIFLIFFQFF